MTDTCPPENSGTILVVESNQPFGELIAELLQAEGYRCGVLPSAARALDNLCSGTALLILDYNLPDMSVEEFVDTMQSVGCKVPFIIITGRDDSLLAVRMMKLGASDFLIKDAVLLDRLPLSVSKALQEKETALRLQWAEEEIRNLSNYDQLTGLPNLNLLQDRLQQAIIHAARNHSVVGVLFLDIDHFKGINDTLGHKTGDLLLRQVAQRLQSCVRESDTLSRLGGDEFVIVLTMVNDEESVSAAASKLLTMVSEPFIVEGHELFITASIGISTYPADGQEAMILMKHADLAMYRAKELDRNNFQFYSSDLNVRVMERMMLESAMRRALERQEFNLLYQPQIDVLSRTIVGFEALLRWHHPDLGLILPDKFIPLAEESGLIVAIGEWVLDTACRQVRTWYDSGLPKVKIAVNISARQLRNGFDNTVAAILHETGLPPELLELEMTESCLMRNVSANSALLRSLTDLGCQLAIDDFGTGYSSLAYLKNFPVGRLKIDRSFVRDIISNSDDLAIAKIIIDMAHTLRKKVTAEGVEAYEQLELLAEHGCTEMQGFLFSRPISADKAELLLQKGLSF
ncbi:MAG: EAL domain-containing protein [Trichlorobacter sp.]|nr:EAL domain-containing protein [Trichlorobacter sp.]